jgi:thioesterase domain-containing protein
MARVLVAQGEEVSFVGLIDTALSSRCLTRTEALAHGRGRLALSWDVLTHGPAGARRDEFAAVRDSLMSLLGRRPPERNPLLQELPPTLGRVRTACDQAFAAYRPGPYAGRVHFFRAGIRDRRRCDPLPVWRRLAGVETITLPGSHFDLIRMPYAQNLATALQIDGAAPPDLPDGPLSEKAPAIGYTIGAE